MFWAYLISAFVIGYFVGCWTVWKDTRKQVDEANDLDELKEWCKVGIYGKSK